MNDLDTILASLIGATQEPPQGEPAAVDAVFERAAPFRDPVMAYLRKEEVWPEGAYDAVEERLMGRLEGVVLKGTNPSAGKNAPVTDESIEAAIAAETVVPHGTWDALEDRLMERIAAAPAPQMAEETAAGKPRYVWPVFTVLAAIPRHRAVQMLLIATVAVIAGLAVILPRAVPVGIVTTITQAWGTAYGSDLGIPLTDGATIASSNGGSLSFRNASGTVSLDGDATLTIARADNRSTEYRVFTAADRRSGRIAFSVEKRTRNQRFVVVTPW
ncbi:MAG: hypothetical protein JXA71_18325, partial [Chitinispirillaceae bacterium]|nr:hypothetical protein [Chitinispirillaceae bacterium]